jgi:predicted RNase H-like nuclease (RuvC/YqgF family)
MLVPNQVEDLEKEIAELKKEVKRLEKIIINFKKYYDGWERCKSQLGL